MGDFRIEVHAVGAHGCARDRKDGEEVYGCGQQNCPDCLTAQYITDMTRAGAMVKSATLTHWPGQPSEVVDAFVLDHRTPVLIRAIRRRKGSFAT